MTLDSDHDDGVSARSQMDLVAAPVRYPTAPLVALVVAALIPLVGLLVLQRWADAEADEFEQTSGVGLFEGELEGSFINGDTPPRPAVVGGGASISTQLLDFRRTPGAMAAIASADQLQGAIEPILGFLSDQSCVAVAVDGLPVISLNPRLPVIPASNQKLLVALAALDVLGPDHRFTTSVAVPPATEGDVTGDLFLIGGGDPVLTSDEFPIADDDQPAFSTTSLDALADAVVGAGVTRIRGAVIGDGTRYDDEFVIDEWASDVPFVEAGPYDALLVNDARVLGRSGVEDDPAEAAAREFVRLLGDRGIRVDNGWGSGVASNLVPVVGTVESAPLSDIIGEMLVTSDNNTAEMLVKEIGVAVSGEGSRAAGLAGVQASLQDLGVSLDGAVLRDGSGLSSGNRVTCSTVLDVLQIGAAGPLASSLPVAAETGTLTDEFIASPVAGRLTAKTGTLGNPPLGEDPPGVKALAGYVPPLPDTGFGTIQFVVIANQELITDPTFYQPLWAAFGERFAGFPAQVDTDSLGPR
jgi:D-alanyl-D-alanine carboxypeptidase/D-alanyl-D-alanine-endopeptidase (penicillin-binding protein 4)